MAEQIHIGDIGTELRFLVLEDGSAMDLSTTSALLIKFRTPENVKKQITPTFVTSGVMAGKDGLIKYITETGFLSETGEWDAQVYVELPNGSRWNTDIVNFHVHPNI